MRNEVSHEAEMRTVIICNVQIQVLKFPTNRDQKKWPVPGLSNSKNIYKMKFTLHLFTYLFWWQLGLNLELCVH